MSSLIANKVKTNICLVSLSLYCTHYLCVPLFPTYTTITITITACSIFFSDNYSLFCLKRRSSNTTIQSHTTSQKINLILTDCRLLCLDMISQTNVLETEGSLSLSRPLVYVHCPTCLYLSPSCLLLLFKSISF